LLHLVAPKGQEKGNIPDRGLHTHRADGVLAKDRIQEVLTTPRAPWQNAYVERFIGSVRRECLDHIIILSADGLRHVLNDYVRYYTRSRTHLALEKDAPTPRPIAPPAAGRIVAIPQVSGLHNRYERRAA
jgi:transposase InsO family protein